MARNMNTTGGRPSSADKKSGKDWLSHQWTTQFEIVSRIDYCSVEVACSVLDDMPAVESYIGIVHGADVNASGVEKIPHLHIMVRLCKQVRNGTVLNKFRKACAASSPVYAAALVENDKTPAVLTSVIRARYCAAVVYLMHLTDEAKRDGKQQYDLADLFGSPGMDVVAEAGRYLDEYNAARASGDDLSADNSGVRVDVNKIMAEVDAGTLSSYNCAVLRDFPTWRAERKVIKDAEAYKAARNAYNGVHPPASVCWMYGGAGSGKTSGAVWMCHDQGYGFPYITSGGRDLFSKYNMQQAVVIDDIRPDKVDADSLIKLLDPYSWGSSFASRYNDVDVAARHIIITCPMSPVEFWSYYDAAAAGSVQQLLRRLNGGVYHYDGDGGFTLHQYNKDGTESGSVYLRISDGYNKWLASLALISVPPAPLYAKYFTSEQLAAAPARRLEFSDSHYSAELCNVIQDALDKFSAEHPEVAADIVAGRLHNVSEIMAALPRSLVLSGDNCSVSVSDIVSETPDDGSVPFPEASDAVSAEVSNLLAEDVSAAPGASVVS